MEKAVGGTSERHNWITAVLAGRDTDELVSAFSMHVGRTPSLRATRIRELYGDSNKLKDSVAVTLIFIIK